LKEVIRQKAFEIGFQDIGFAKYELLSEEIDFYKIWLDKNLNAEMRWMEKNIDKREDVSKILPDVKSVIVLSYNYYSGYDYKDYSQGKTGKISRYAWNFDYHDIIRPKLFQLGDFITSHNQNHNFKAYVDTGPILEKIWAEKSGIGWQGKNSLIISKKFGSYFFLGIILSNMEYEYDSPVKDYCMSCTKCIDACPTNAIIEQKIIDSRKCISYWTIESKPANEFPKTIADNLTGWAFGCDICQEVCPWNKHKPKITDDFRLNPRNKETILDKNRIIKMTQEEFSERFRKSPIKRTKIAGLKRNFKYL
jgi:epoxyqueuosine reductase